MQHHVLDNECLAALKAFVKYKIDYQLVPPAGHRVNALNAPSTPSKTISWQNFAQLYHRLQFPNKTNLFSMQYHFESALLLLYPSIIVGLCITCWKLYYHRRPQEWLFTL